MPDGKAANSSVFVSINNMEMSLNRFALFQLMIIIIILTEIIEKRKWNGNGNTDIGNDQKNTGTIISRDNLSNNQHQNVISTKRQLSPNSADLFVTLQNFR